MKFLDRVNFYGQVAEIDAQGRVLIQPRLRDSAQMAGEVDVLGQQKFLEVWNHERFIAKLTRDPFTERRREGAGGFRDLSEGRTGRPGCILTSRCCVDEVVAAAPAGARRHCSSIARSGWAVTRARCSSGRRRG